MTSTPGHKRTPALARGATFRLKCTPRPPGWTCHEIWRRRIIGFTSALGVACSRAPEFSWRPGPPCSIARFEAMEAAVRGGDGPRRLLHGPTRCHLELQVYDPVGDRWRDAAPLPSALRRSSASLCPATTWLWRRRLHRSAAAHDGRGLAAANERRLLRGSGATSAAARSACARPAAGPTRGGKAACEQYPTPSRRRGSEAQASSGSRQPPSLNGGQMVIRIARPIRIRSRVSSSQQTEVRSRRFVRLGRARTSAHTSRKSPIIASVFGEGIGRNARYPSRSTDCFLHIR
jgi:hypothetical protein